MYVVHVHQYVCMLYYSSTSSLVVLSSTSVHVPTCTLQSTCVRVTTSSNLDKNNFTTLLYYDLIIHDVCRALLDFDGAEK